MFDILIKDGTIIDGSGSPMYSGSIGIVGKTIESIGSIKNKVAKITIDAQGKVVCPGFIDIHSHADLVDIVVQNKITVGIKYGDISFLASLKVF